jgi:hypothetical protein
VNRWKASCRGDRARNREADDPAVRAPCVEGGTAVGGGGVRGWLRLAGGDNAIGMIQGDLVGSEQSVVTTTSTSSACGRCPGVARWFGSARLVGAAITRLGKGWADALRGVRRLVVALKAG